MQPGEVLAVVGPSGAGKSSFLRLINRLDEPTGGTVLLNGQDYRDIAPRELRRRVGMGMAQAAGAVALCLAVVLLCRRFAVHVEREAAISIVCGLVQMVLVGAVLALLLHGHPLLGVLILLIMTFAAAVTASRRLPEIEGSLHLSFYAIGLGAGIVIAAMLATRTLHPDIMMLVPVGSMIIANAMNACAQARSSRMWARSKRAWRSVPTPP